MTLQPRDPARYTRILQYYIEHPTASHAEIARAAGASAQSSVYIVLHDKDARGRYIAERISLAEAQRRLDQVRPVTIVDTPAGPSKKARIAALPAYFGPRDEEGERHPVGDPINFRGMVYGPTNESGVIILFSKVMADLGIIYEGGGTRFPDMQGRWKTRRGWLPVRIEFEYRSSDFKRHHHSAPGCDMIVCWEHDWKECPSTIRVLELKTEMEKLRDRSA